jgi:hypothetical protein
MGHNAMIRWLLKPWRAHLRRIDLRVLWPECKRQAKALEQTEIAPLDLAKAAFMSHCANDPVWTLDYSEAELVDFINRGETNGS